MRLLVSFWMMAGRANSGTACGRERHCGIGRVVLCADDCLYQDDADVQQSGYSKKGENELARAVFRFGSKRLFLPVKQGMKLYPDVVHPCNWSPFQENLFARMINVPWERSQCSVAKTVIIGMPYLIGIDSGYFERWIPIGAETLKVFRSMANPLHSFATSMHDRRAF